VNRTSMQQDAQIYYLNTGHKFLSTRGSNVEDGRVCWSLQGVAPTSSETLPPV
jgi:hypothetical protein